VETDDKLEALLQSGFRYAYSLTHQAAEAEDLVQEAWLKLTRSKQSAWNKSLFFVALRNLFIDRYRHTRLVVMEPLDEVFIEQANESASELEVAMDITLLERSLCMLRVEEREAIYLHLVEGYSAAEVAELTDRSRNTVLSLIHRGRKKLLNALADTATACSN
jgi:RNA polymerase sigma-70 factor, ECF subfamily